MLSASRLRPSRTRGLVRHAIESIAGTVPTSIMVKSGLGQNDIGKKERSPDVERIQAPPKPHTRFGETRN
jgi:hypothetical protein